MNKIICLLGLSIVVLSCKERPAVLKYEDVAFPKEVMLQGEGCGGNFMFNAPQDLFVVDSLIVISDNNDKGTIHIFNKAGVHKGSAVNKGRGGGEVVSVGSVDVRGDKVLICDPNQSRLVVYDLSRILGGVVPSCVAEYSLLAEAQWARQARWYKGDSIVVMGGDAKMRYGVVKGNEIAPVYVEYPQAVPDGEENAAVWTYFAQWKFKPDYSKMVTTTYIGSIFEIIRSDKIHDMASEKTMALQEPKYALAQGAIPKWITSSDETTIGFEDAYATDSCIYLLSYGVNVTELEDNLPTVCVFSWDGEAVARYSFPERVLTFGVDAAENAIYAVVADGDNICLKRYGM